MGTEDRIIEGNGRGNPSDKDMDEATILPWVVGERAGIRPGEDMGAAYLGTALCRLSLLAMRAGWFMRLRDPGVASSLARVDRVEYGS